MHDFKNILIAWLSSTTVVFTAIETKTLVTIISAIILPILFFSIGKTVDVMLQIYLRNREIRSERGQNDDPEN